MFCPEALVRTVTAGLRQRAAQLDAEQAVHGLDSLAELSLHPVVKEAFAEAGLGVLAEWPYPSFLRPPGGKSAGRPTRRPLAWHPRERQRCDVVLLTEPAATLADPAAEEKAAREAAEAMPLFAGLEPPPGQEFPGPPGRPQPLRVGPESAFWLELKVIGQHTYSAGIPKPNHTYTSELLATAAADIPKLAADPAIRRGGLLIVLFTADQMTAEHDLGVFSRCACSQASVGRIAMAGFRIVDRIGNRWCQAALAPIARA